MVVVLVWAAIFLIFAPSSAKAIPSPDLIAGSISSLSQLFALLSAVVGGLAFTGTGLLRPAARRSASPGSRRLRLVLITGAALGLCASLALNLYQYDAAKDARLDRLQASIARPSHDPGQPILDPTLKEMSYNEQLRDPLGISTGQLAKLLHEADAGKAANVNFIDIRESGETELGMLPHFTPVRWPDLATSGIDLKGKQNVLICHNGNRSSETCEALSKLGIPCQFMVGGLEKWIAEGRPVGNSGLRSPDQLRGVPHYHNDSVLLDTPAVRRILGQEHGIVVETRYPGEFAHQHMPGAYNISIRSTPTTELNERIAALPRQPVVLACYDRRSCFMSMALGLDLVRAGLDVRGRYTVPWEYFIPTKEPPYVAAWRARIGQSMWAKASRRLGDALHWSADHGVSLPLAIILLALLSRMTVLPFSFKAERDQVKLRSLAPIIAAARQRFDGDPKRFARFLKAIHRQEGVTPGRNLLALLFLPVLMLCVAGVNAAANLAPQGLWWMTDLTKPDPWHILPLAFGAAVAFYLVISLARTRPQQLVAGVGGLAVFAVLAAFLSAAVDLYLVASVVIMLMQRVVLAIDVAAWRRRIARAQAAHSGIIPLARAHLFEHCGNKAARLGMMRAAGLPVPDGLVLTPRFLERFARAGAKRQDRALDRLWRKLGAVPLAVRSSAAAEDGREQSFAGVFETVLHVERAGLADAIARVAASFAGARSETYAGGPQSGHILLQPMVAAEFAGVLFTRAPASGVLAMIELVRGTADDFVSGRAAPETYALGRFSGRPRGEAAPPVDLSELFLLGRRLEARFGVPQDIEWAYGGGRFLLLQSRDITRTQLDHAEAGPARLESERERLALIAAADPGVTPALAQNELSELLPRPSPAALDLMAALWASGGGVDLACRAIGLSYAVEEDSPALLATAYGRLYVDKTEERKRTLKLGWLGARRLERAAGDIETAFCAQFLPKFSEQVRLLEAVEYCRLRVPELQQQLERVRTSFVTETCAQVEVVNIAANFYVERAKAALAARGLNPANYLGDLDETPIAHALAAAHGKEATEERIDAFLESFGHRAALDYELAQPRYAEDRATVAALVSMPGPALRGEPPATAQITDHNWQDDKLRAVIERARRFQILKEQAKHEALREIALLRRILLALDRALGLEGGIFQLKFAEIAAIAGNGAVAELRATISRRRAEAELFGDVPPLPAELDLQLLETVSLTDSAPAQGGSDALSGTLVSGGAPVTGRARVVSPQAAERGDPIDGFVDGDIIVSRMIHAAWLPYFSRAGGLVCEVGGWLSHIAILAREYNLPLVIGVAGIATIKTGEALQIEVDGRVVRVADAGLPPVPMPALPGLAPPAEDPNSASYAAAAQ